jgi:hypothetical protein
MSGRRDNADSRRLAVLGICPHCGSPDARSDGRLVDPTDLIQPHSAISGNTSLELNRSRHRFLRRSQLVARLRGGFGFACSFFRHVMFGLQQMVQLLLCSILQV